MRATRQTSVTPPNAMADAVRARVAPGHGASESEVVREGLRALAEQELCGGTVAARPGRRSP